MTTPVCNCPEDIGWLPEGNWPFRQEDKNHVGRIYCIGGVPVVAPNTQFYTAGEAVVYFTASGNAANAIPFVGGGSNASPNILTGPNAVIYPMTYVNQTAFTQNWMIHTACDVTATIHKDSLVYIGPRITISGSVNHVINPMAPWYGSEIAGGLSGAGAGFRQYSFVFPIGGIPPGGQFTVTQQLSYFWSSGPHTVNDERVYYTAITTRGWGGGS